MSDANLGQFSEGFASWRQILGTVPPDDRLKIFANAAAEVAGYIVKGLHKTVAADELTDMAIACGLDDPDMVQATIVEALNNGHNASERGPKGDGKGSPISPTSVGTLNGARREET